VRGGRGEVGRDSALLSLLWCNKGLGTKNTFPEWRPIDSVEKKIGQLLVKNQGVTDNSVGEGAVKRFKWPS